MFFSFDGVDGVGKSTQMEQFCQWLTARGHQVVTCRDPGSTTLGEQIRQIVLESGPETPVARRSEMLLYTAARAQLVEEVIRPALEQGATVVSDRFLLANVVYQAYAGGLDVESTWQVGEVATAGLRPDLTFLLDMPQEDAHRRLARAPDRMESQGDDFRARLRDGFLKEAARKPEQIVVIDAAGSIEAVHTEIVTVAKRVLAPHNGPH